MSRILGMKNKFLNQFRLLGRFLVAPVVFSPALSFQANAHGLGTSNQSALTRGVALPSLSQHSLSSAGQAQWRFSGELTSEYVSTTRPGERLVIDGETQTYGLNYRYQVSDRTDLGFEAAIVHTGAGFLDHSIETWHDWFGLPNGGRERAPRNRYRYFYERNGAVLLDESEGFTGLSDLEVSAGYLVLPGLSLRGMVKLPTASNKVLGGKALGAAIWTQYSASFGSKWPVQTSLSAGLSISNTAGPLKDLQNPVVPLGAAGISLKLSSNTSILGQMYAHGPVFDDSEIRALGHLSAQLALGLRWCPLRAKNCYEILFQEDAAVESSPDFSLRLAVTGR